MRPHLKENKFIKHFDSNYRNPMKIQDNFEKFQSGQTNTTRSKSARFGYYKFSPLNTRILFRASTLNKLPG